MGNQNTRHGGVLELWSWLQRNRTVPQHLISSSVMQEELPPLIGWIRTTNQQLHSHPNYIVSSRHVDPLSEVLG